MLERTTEEEYCTVACSPFKHPLERCGRETFSQIFQHTRTKKTYESHQNLKKMYQITIVPLFYTRVLSSNYRRYFFFLLCGELFTPVSGIPDKKSNILPKSLHIYIYVMVFAKSYTLLITSVRSQTFPRPDATSFANGVLFSYLVCISSS